MKYSKNWAPRKNKYNNKNTIYNRIAYDSEKEAQYAEKLDWMVWGKEIKSWDRQIKIPLIVNGKLICNYYIDFIDNPC